MALLLAMYQKMKLIREKNQATFDLTKFSSKYDRVSKNIEKVQKRYTSLFANLDAQAKQMQSNAKIMFQDMYGLGMGSYGNYLEPSSFSGLNGFITTRMGQMLMSSFEYKDKDNNTQTFPGLTQDEYSNMLAEYMQNGGFVPKYDTVDGVQKVARDDNNQIIYENGWSAEQVAFFNQAMQNAKLQQQQAQMACSNMSQQYDTNVSVWLEAAKAQLEAEQDAALEPLNYQQTMWELEKEQAEQRLQRIKAELESYTQLCSEEAKEQAPKFGLG